MVRAGFAAGLGGGRWPSACSSRSSRSPPSRRAHRPDAARPGPGDRSPAPARSAAAPRGCPWSPGLGSPRSVPRRARPDRTGRCCRCCTAARTSPRGRPMTRQPTAARSGATTPPRHGTPALLDCRATGWRWSPRTRTRDAAARGVPVPRGRPDRRVPNLHVPLDPDHPTVPTLARSPSPPGGSNARCATCTASSRWNTRCRPPGPARALALAAGTRCAATPGSPPPFGDRSGPFPFLDGRGPGVYEIPVGPVHAGLIEPGHFRFSVVGETILRLKARLWFVHKGIEKLFEGRDPAGGLRLAERICGDTAVGHALAYAARSRRPRIVEVPLEAQRMRAMLLELERLLQPRRRHRRALQRRRPRPSSTPMP